MKEKLPSVQVFEFKPELTHSVWVDFMHRCRTKNGLVKMLRKMVKSGEIVGFRFMTIHEEHIGRTWTTGSIAKAEGKESGDANS